MTIGVIPGQIFRATPSSASVNSIALTVSGTTRGNTLVAFPFVNDSTTASLAGSVSGDFGPAVVTVDDAGFSHYSMSAFVLPNIQGGTETVAAVFDVPSTQYDLFVVEVRNVALNPVDGFMPGTPQPTPGTATDSVTTGSGVSSTNANQPALILGLGFVQAVGLLRGTGFTDLGSYTGSASVGGTFRLESRRVTTTAAQQATWTPSHNNNALSLMVILDELVIVPSGAVPPKRPRRIISTVSYPR